MQGGRHRALWYAIALLVVGSAIPSLAGAHVEGTEVTDPNTPPAVLSFDSAAAHYTGLDATLSSWTAQARTESEPGPSAGARARHPGTADSVRATPPK